MCEKGLHHRGLMGLAPQVESSGVGTAASNLRLQMLDINMQSSMWGPATETSGHLISCCARTQCKSMTARTPIAQVFARSN